jgi:bifunctional non-homologous end joining protein LigD
MAKDSQNCGSCLYCVPTAATKVPASPERLQEIKYDGYRLRLERNGDRVRLLTRGDYDWTRRFPWIVETALKNHQKQFVIDGEAVILGVDGVSDLPRVRQPLANPIGLRMLPMSSV